MIPLYFVAAACISVVLNIWAESVNTGRPPKETARKLIEATSNWVVKKSRATVDYVGRLHLGRHIRFPRVRSNLVAAHPHEFVLVDYRSPLSLRRLSRALARPGFCTVDVLKPWTPQLPAVPSQLNSVALYEPRHASAVAHSSFSPSARISSDFNTYTGTFALVLVVVIPSIAVVVGSLLVVFWRTRRVDKVHRQLLVPMQFVQDVAPTRLILGLADVTDILLQFDNSTLEFIAGDVKIKGIVPDELVLPLEELDPAPNDLSITVTGLGDAMQDIVDDDPDTALVSSAAFELEEPVAPPNDADNIGCEVDNDPTVPAALKGAYAATHDVPTSSAVTEVPSVLDAINVPLPAAESDDFLDYIDLVTYQDNPPSAVSTEVPAPLTAKPQVVIWPSPAAFTDVSGDSLGGACPPSVLNRLIEIQALAMQKRMLHVWQLNHRDDPTSHPPAKTSGKGKEKEKAPEEAPEQPHVSSWTVNAFPTPEHDFIRGKKVHNRHMTVSVFPSPPSPPPPPPADLPDQPESAEPRKKTRRGGEAYRRQQQRIKDAEDMLVEEAAEKVREAARYATATIVGHANHRVSESIRLPDDPLALDASRPHVVQLVDLIVSRRGSPLVAPEDPEPPSPRNASYNPPFGISPSPNYGARQTQPYDEDDDDYYDDNFPPFAPSGGAAISLSVASTSTTAWSATVPLAESLTRVAALWADVDSWDADPDTPTSSTPGQASSSSSSAPASVSGPTPSVAPPPSRIPRPSSSLHTPRQQQTSRTSSATHEQAAAETQSPPLPPSTSHTGRGQHSPSSNAGPSRPRGSRSSPSATVHAPTPGPSSSSQIPRPDPTSTSSTTTRPDSSSRQRSRGQPSTASQPPRSASSSSTTNATTQNASRTTTGASMTTTKFLHCIDCDPSPLHFVCTPPTAPTTGPGSLFDDDEHPPSFSDIDPPLRFSDRHLPLPDLHRRKLWPRSR